jgi:F-type H+/Na+-transporting ATPase subunit alpha
VLLYAAANGYIDSYPESALRKYEEQLNAFVEKDHGDLLKDIKEKKEITAAIEEKLEKALDAFKTTFTY